MRVLLLAAVIAQMLPTSGSIRAKQLGEPSAPIPAMVAADWEGLNKRAYLMFQKGQYRPMLKLLEPARGWIERFPMSSQAMKTLEGLGIAESYSFQYQDAVRDNLAGREIARKLGDINRVGGFSHNLSNLYIILHSQREAMAAADEAIEAFQSTNHPTIQPQLLLHKARLTMLQGDFAGAVPIFREGIQAAEAGGNLMLQTTGLEGLGLGFLRERRLEEAETALVASFRLRKLFRDAAITSSYQALGLLRLAQGDKHSALRLFDLAVQGPRQGRRHPAWSAYFGRGKVYAAQGRLGEALQDLRVAMRQIEEGRIHQIQADSMRVSSGMGVQEVYSEFIAVGARLYAENHRQELVEETLLAAEANRALGLRQASLEPARLNRRLPAAYGAGLGRLQTAYAALHRDASPERRREVERLRLGLTEMEASAGGATAMAARIPFRKEWLDPSQALLVFHLGEDSSYLWETTRGGVRLHRLASKRVLAKQVGRLREAIEKDAPEAEQLGAGLYAALFATLGEAGKKSDWLIVPDDALHQLPFAALVPQRGRVGGYLVEQHSLLVLPGLWAIGNSGRRGARWPGPAVAVADPVYNRADARWTEEVGWPYGLWRRSTGTAAVELARLPGSGAEVEACRRVWAEGGVGSVKVLQGREATVESLERALQSRPALVHFATHVVRSPDNDRENLLALSLNGQGEAQLVGPEWITSRRLEVALVMMSGCQSGTGEIKQGEGLMGLTRAWLMAGAGAVAATHWPIPDEGQFAQSFYRHWMKGKAVPDAHQAGVALQAAQVEMIRSGSFRNRPRYWASYFVVGKS